MLRRALGPLFLAFLWLHPSLILAQSEEERRRGFYEHQKESKAFDQEREAGLKEYLREQAAWEEQRKKDAQTDKQRRKDEAPAEGGPEYKADRQRRYENFLEHEAERRAYVAEKKSHEAKTAKEQAKREAWAMEEYGLDQERPRFDISKRQLYGGKPGSGGGGNSNGFGSSPNYGGEPSFPPPPAFDDFGEGYVPPPVESFEPPPEGFPPPPPMPMPGESGDFDGGYFPPPPPPIPMDEGM